jgi:hypothetical protein
MLLIYLYESTYQLRTLCYLECHLLNMKKLDDLGNKDSGNHLPLHCLNLFQLKALMIRKYLRNL